jgi:hypothetical protein
LYNVTTTPATLAVKGGTIGLEIWLENSELTLLLGFFYMPQICDMGQDGFYFPSEEFVMRNFFLAP